MIIKNEAFKSKAYQHSVHLRKGVHYAKAGSVKAAGQGSLAEGNAKSTQHAPVKRSTLR